MGQQKKKWSEFSPAQKAGSIVAGIVQVALLIAALVDIRRRPAEEIRGRKGTVGRLCLRQLDRADQLLPVWAQADGGEITSESAA